VQVAERVEVERVDVAAYTVPTERPESDGTLAWDATTLVVVEVDAGGEKGLGWSYAHPAAAVVVAETLAPLVREAADPLAVETVWAVMARALRNAGLPGIGSCAVSAVDVALWDLRARVLGTPLCDLLGRARERVPVYGSGGFTSEGPVQVAEQLGGWVADGIPRVKLKVGRDPDADPARLDAARGAVGDAELMADANGAWRREEALAWAGRLHREWGIAWLEEPVSSDDAEGLHLVRDGAPPGLEVAAGEYAYVAADFRALVCAVDCLQADVTRCGGVTGFLRAAALADAFGLDVSAHCAPALHLAPCLAVPRLRHAEWFADHVRIERMLFDGVPVPEGGDLVPDRSRPGHGYELRRADAERYRH
jgi:L-alanine-DL-glutamate epimerase-like enolase superfamily enzyme